MKEYNVPDMVKSMSWCGENICLGIRKEYVILNAANGALSEVFPSGRLAPPLVVSLPSGELLLGKVFLSLLAIDTQFTLNKIMKTIKMFRSARISSLLLCWQNLCRI